MLEDDVVQRLVQAVHKRFVQMVQVVADAVDDADDAQEALGPAALQLRVALAAASSLAVSKQTAGVSGKKDMIRHKVPQWPCSSARGIFHICCKRGAFP